jgi:hypothetical protein
MSLQDRILNTVALAPMTTLAIADELDCHYTKVRNEIGPLLKSGALVVRGHVGGGHHITGDRMPLFGLPVALGQARAA